MILTDINIIVHKIACNVCTKVYCTHNWLVHTKIKGMSKWKMCTIIFIQYIHVVVSQCSKVHNLIF